MIVLKLIGSTDIASNCSSYTEAVDIAFKELTASTLRLNDCIRLRYSFRIIINFKVIEVVVSTNELQKKANRSLLVHQFSALLDN